MQLKELNGEFPPAALIDLLQTLELSWDARNSFLPRAANQENVRASQNRDRKQPLLPRNSSPEPRATCN